MTESIQSEESKLSDILKKNGINLDPQKVDVLTSFDDDDDDQEAKKGFHVHHDDHDGTSLARALSRSLAPSLPRSLAPSHFFFLSLARLRVLALSLSHTHTLPPSSQVWITTGQGKPFFLSDCLDSLCRYLLIFFSPSQMMMMTMMMMMRMSTETGACD
jgi:hypothetical protein